MKDVVSTDNRCFSALERLLSALALAGTADEAPKCEDAEVLLLP
jgi:hypothetical protein